MAVAVRLPAPSREATAGLCSRTVGLHPHAFGLQRSHIRATHVRGLEIDQGARSEPCVVEQRLDVGEVWVVVEVEERQAREPAQRFDVGDRVVLEAEGRQACEAAQRADVADGVVAEVEVCQAREPAQRADVADLVRAEGEERQAREILNPHQARDPGEGDT